MKVEITITAPGSSGELELEVNEEQRQFLEAFVLRWNDANPNHAQPYIELMEKK